MFLQSHLYSVAAMGLEEISVLCYLCSFLCFWLSLQWLLPKEMRHPERSFGGVWVSFVQEEVLQVESQGYQDSYAWHRYQV